jgi:hypothetical protein
LVFHSDQILKVIQIAFAENCMPNLATFPDYFLRFVSSFSHAANTGVIFQQVIGHTLEHGVLFKLGYLPVVEVFNISHSVDKTSGFETVGIVRKEGCVYDSATVITFFEMRVRKAEKHFS